ncbi:MAG: CBS domain-containing protein [Fusicatenibacter sp.]
MNILFFITPKSETAYIYDDFTLRQAIEKIEYHKYTAIPMLNRRGNYIGTVTEGDLLRIVKEQYSLNLRDAEEIPIWQVPRRWNYEPVNINCNIEDLIDMSMRQNFVPVVDDEGVFIGLIRRRDIIQYCYRKSGIREEEQSKWEARDKSQDAE